jgi:hypothetical protein
MKDSRLAVVHSYLSDLLDPWSGLVGALEGVGITTHHAPYGVSLEEARAELGLVTRAGRHPDVAAPGRSGSGRSKPTSAR